MEKQLFLVKEQRDYLKLLNDLYNEARRVTDEVGEGVEWLQYAMKKEFGYTFLERTERRWLTLQRIAGIAKKKNPGFSFGFIVDQLSDLVNTRVVDSIIGMERQLPDSLNLEEKVYLERLLIQINPGKIVPRHPWIIRKLLNGREVYKDLVSNTQYTLKKFYKSSFVYFYFELI